MIHVRRAQERRHERRRGREAWLTFYARDRSDPLADGFGTLQMLNVHRLPPGASLPRGPVRGTGLLTYVRSGALACEDSLGRLSVIHAGEFSHTADAPGITYTETNPSRTEWAEVVQTWLRSPETRVEPRREQKRFSAGQRRGRLFLVASPDGRRGSLRVHNDSAIYSAILDPGQHVVSELPARRCAWLHVMEGEVAFGDLVLYSGDGAGVATERAISFTARENTEILLIHAGSHVSGLPDRDGGR